MMDRKDWTHIKVKARDPLLCAGRRSQGEEWGVESAVVSCDSSPLRLGTTTR